MTTQEIANFIKSQQQLGSSKEEIEKILTLNHVAPGDIATAFNLTGSASAPAVPPAPQAPIPPAPAMANNQFPPPAMALDSIDSVKPSTPPPVTPTPASSFRPTPPPPIMPPPPPSPVAPMPPRPNSQLNVPIIPTAPTAIPRRSSGGAWILLLLILIIIGAGLYTYITKPAWATPLLNLIEPPVAIEQPVSVTPTPPIVPVDPTADWLTYRNDQYGFEFKYPATFNLIATSSLRFATSAVVVLRETTPSGGAIDFPTISVTMSNVWDKNPDGSLKKGQSMNLPEIEAYDSGWNVMELGDFRSVNLVSPQQLRIGFSSFGENKQPMDNLIATFHFFATSTATTTSASSSTSTQPPAVNLPSLFLPQ